MHAPILVTPPATTPVSLIEAKAHLHVETVDYDTLITNLIEAATAYLDGWRGVLGRAIVTQTWRQDFDAFCQKLDLPLGPVQSITSVRWQATDGTWSTIAPINYALKTDAGGRAYVRFENAYGFPSPLYEIGAVQVEYVAGEVSVSAADRQIVLMLVGHWYENREAVSEGTFNDVPLSARALIGSRKRVSC